MGDILVVSPDSLLDSLRDSLGDSLGDSKGDIQGGSLRDILDGTLGRAIGIA